MRATFILLALLIAAPATAKPLTVHTGESWVFVIDHGQPSRARRVMPNVKPKHGEVLVTVRAMLGTTMSITSNNRQAYTYRAELVGTAQPVKARSCALPANPVLSFESWPDKASAIRLSDFKPATNRGSCP